MQLNGGRKNEELGSKQGNTHLAAMEVVPLIGQIGAHICETGALKGGYSTLPTNNIKAANT